MGKKDRRRLGLVAQSCLTLWHPVDCSPPGSSVHGILRARRLEWAAMPSPKGPSQPRSPTLQADSLPPDPPEKPKRRNQRDRELEGDRETEKDGNRDKEAERKREEEG